MTIHASKGLEFPIVALANLGTRPRNDVEPVPDRRAHRLHLRVKAGDYEFKTTGFDDAWTHEKEQKAAEEKRLLYVAVTRARDHLILPVASVPDKPGPMLFDLLDSLPEWDETAARDAGQRLPPLRPDDCSRSFPTTSLRSEPRRARQRSIAPSPTEKSGNPLVPPQWTRPRTRSRFTRPHRTKETTPCRPPSPAQTTSR